MHNILTIKYFDIEYKISTEFNDGLFTSSTGDTLLNRTFDYYDDKITFECDSNFINYSNIKDNIIISLFNSSATTYSTNGIEIPSANLNYYTTIKEISGNTITINDNIPFYIYNDLANSGYSYRIRNLHYSEYSYFQLMNYVNASPFNQILRAEITNNELKLIPDSEYKYFDYSFLSFDYSEINGGTTSTSAYTFNTDNQYAEYELKTFIDNIFTPLSGPTNIYNENSLCSGNYHIQEIYDTSNNHQYISGGWYPIQSSRYKIIPIDSHKHTLKSFKPYTYIDFGDLTKVTTNIPYDYYDRANLELSSVTFIANKSPYEISDSGRTMITEVYEDYMIIEKPFNDNTSLGFTGGTGTVSGITGVYDLVNVAKLDDIADILLKAYLNKNSDYYETKSDSERYRISAAYGRIIKNNSIIRNNSTGMVYQDENDLFNLDIFNINVDENYKYDDPNLLYTPVEIFNLGIDKKIKTPIPIEIEDININYESENIFISGTTINYNNVYQEKSFIWDSLNINDKNYTIIEWSDRLLISGNTLDTLDTQNNSNSRSLLLLTIENNEISKYEPINYEWLDNERKIDYVKLIKNDSNINILITHFDNRDEKNITLQSSTYTTTNNNHGSDLLFYNTSSLTFTSVIQYSANTSISFFNNVYDSNHNKYMLGRYYHESPDLINVDNVELDIELNYTSILTKSDSGNTMLWNKKIRHLTNPNATTGPIITQLEIDDNDNLYLFGNLTNYDGYVEIGVGDETPINKDIIKPNNENYSLISKINSDGITLWNKVFKASDNSLFLNPKIKYYDKFIYFSFNFSETIKIEDTTYSTESDQIINSICGKMNNDGEIEYVKFLESNRNNNIVDFTVDEDYIYYLGEFKGEAFFDDYDLFSSGESGYIIKIRKIDGIIINIIEIYSDESLNLETIINDSETITISGSWSGNIYVDKFIKNTNHEEFFITNIKKKDI